MNRSRFLKTALTSTALIALALSNIAQAQTWPSKPVKLVLGAPAGTAPDIAARLLADKLSATWGQPVLVENKPGAGGIIAMEQVRTAPTDGHTLMFAHAGAVVLTPLTFKAAKYDPVNDFTTLGIIADAPMMIVANNEVGGKTVADMLSGARAKPGQLTVGSTGQATLPFLVGRSIADASGVTFQDIPFNQPTTAINSLIKGDLQYYIDGIGPLLQLVKSGKIRAIAVTGNNRLPGLEDVPLVKDTVINFSAVGWFALMGPKGLPADLVQKVNKDMSQALANPDVVTKYRDISLFSLQRNQVDSSAFLRSEVVRWTTVIKKVGIEPQ